MILLITSEYDISTNNVISWLNNSKKNIFLRINFENQTKLNVFKINDKEVSIFAKNIDFKLINTVWHRRGRIRFIPKTLIREKETYTYLKREEDSLIKSIELYLSLKNNYIGSYIKEVENFKLSHLITARECDFNIPESIVTTSKKELKNFFNKNIKIITKDLRYPVNIKIIDVNIYSKGTFLVSELEIEELNNNFAPIFVQKYIEKKFEIRVYFFNKKLYSMAIFSQNDDKTIIDYRNYNHKNPNRCVPINLPEKIINNILLFIKKTNLNTGSIDLIYSKDKKFVFLEVNPMGQFDWLSKNCNYYIEREIAKYLVKTNEKS